MDGCVRAACTTDNEAPQIVTCQAPIAVHTNVSKPNATVIFVLPTATDNSHAVPTYACNATSGNAFPMGVTLVTCTATDGSNNVNESCTFTITVTGEL
jgi:hypothetical protein